MARKPSRVKPQPTPYEARYGFTPIVLAAPVALGFAGCFVWGMVVVVQEQPPRPGDSFSDYYVYLAAFLTLLGSVAVMFVVMAVSWLVAVATRRLALRVDKNGITLGRVPFPPSRLVTVPWRDITTIVLFERQKTIGPCPVGFSVRVRHIGLRLEHGADRPPGVPTPGTARAMLYRINAGRKPWPADVYRAAYGWHLDENQLESTVRSYVRHVVIRQDDD
jgi:hypothetical protein